MKKIRIVSLILLLISILVSIDLLVNVLGNINSLENDGLRMYTVFIWGNIYLGDSLWTFERFLETFKISITTTFLLSTINIALTIKSIYDNK